MDFIRQLKAFDEQSYRKVTPNAYVIYFKLFMINNNMHWEEWFEVSDSEITFSTGIKRRESIVRALNLLKQHGFIDFRRGGSGRTTSYKIIPLSNSATSYPQQLLNSASDSASDSASLENPLINNKNVNVNGNVNNTRTRKKFVPPTLEEVNQYVLEMGLHVSAKDFLDYFTATGWIDSTGKKVVSWKGKIHTWEKFNKPDQQKKTRLQENFEAADRAIAYFESQEANRNDEGNGDSEAATTVYDGVPF